MKFTDLDLKNESQVIAWLKENYPIGTKVVSAKTGDFFVRRNDTNITKCLSLNNSYYIGVIFIIYEGKLTPTTPLCSLEPQQTEQDYEIY
jgi:hypothetical protein